MEDTDVTNFNFIVHSILLILKISAIIYKGVLIVYDMNVEHSLHILLSLKFYVDS